MRPPRFREAGHLPRRRPGLEAKQVLRSHLQGEIRCGPGICRPQHHQQVDAGRPGANSLDFQEPSLDLSCIQPLHALELSLCKGEGRCVEGAGLGAGKTKAPQFGLSRRQHVGRVETAEAGSESRPDGLPGLQGDQLVRDNP